jgi:hypothetical protein
MALSFTKLMVCCGVVRLALVSYGSVGCGMLWYAELRCGPVRSGRALSFILTGSGEVGYAGVG